MSPGHRQQTGTLQWYYLTPEDQWEVGPDVRVTGFDPRADEAMREDRPIRRISIPFMGQDDHLQYMGLHWSDGRDLTVLDEAVVAGHPVPVEALEDAMAGYLTRFPCPGGGHTVVRLAVDGGLQLPLPDGSERYRRHSFVRRCPECDSELPPGTLAVLYLVE